MKKFMIVISGLILMVQLAVAQEIDSNQGKLFDHLNINKAMSQKQRTDICADALNAGRSIKVPAALSIGMGLALDGAASVAFLLGNARKADLSHFQKNLNAINDKFKEQLQSGKYGQGELNAELDAHLQMATKKADQVRRLTVGAVTTRDPAYNISRALYNEEKSVEWLYQSFKATFSVQLANIERSGATNDLEREIEAVDSFYSRLNKGVDQALDNPYSKDFLAALSSKSQSVYTAGLHFSEGKKVGGGRAYKSFLDDIHNYTNVGESEIARNSKVLKNVGRGVALLGAVFEIYGAYSIYEDASKSESGPYSLKTATLGNVRGVCQKAVSDDFDSSAVQSVNSVIDFAAAVKGYSVAAELDAEPTAVKSVDGKTSK